LIESSGRTMREILTSGSLPFRNAYLRSLIDVIPVDDAQFGSWAARMCSKGPSWLVGREVNLVRR
jgi:hypothetical protein